MSALSSSLSSKDSTIKDMCASKRFLSQELDTAKRNIGVLEGDREVLKACYNKAMDNLICVGRLLMKRSDVVVPDDIVADVLSVSGTAAKAPAPGGPKVDSAPEGASA